MSILDRFTLTDHVAVVTGAGRGIGAATAVALAEAGADVLISSRTEAQLLEVKERVEATGRRAVVVPANLAHTDEVAALAQAAYDAFGRLDVVVNNVAAPSRTPSSTPTWPISRSPSTSTSRPRTR